MKYTAFTRPNARTATGSVMLDEHFEDLAQKCINHPDGIRFTFEDCKHVFVFCFEAYPEDDEPEPCDIAIKTLKIPNSEKAVIQAWKECIAEAAEKLGIG